MAKARSICNDCSSCVTSNVNRVSSGCLYFLLGGFIIEQFATKCPKCGHQVSSHQTKFNAVARKLRTKRKR